MGLFEVSQVLLHGLWKNNKKRDAVGKERKSRLSHQICPMTLQIKNSRKFSSRRGCQEVSGCGHSRLWWGLTFFPSLTKSRSNHKVNSLVATMVYFVLGYCSSYGQEFVATGNSHIRVQRGEYWCSVPSFLFVSLEYHNMEWSLHLSSSHWCNPLISSLISYPAQLAIHISMLFSLGEM